MIGLAPSRLPPARSTPNASPLQRPTARVVHYDAPVRGLISSAPPDGMYDKSATRLDNFWPTATGITPRGGTRRVLTLPGGVKSLFTHPGGRFFGAADETIYEINPEESRISAAINNFNTDAVSVANMRTAGGNFLILLNGRQTPRIFDGQTWHVMSGARYTLTGLDIARLSHGFTYRNRLFFIERDSQQLWYLPVGHIAGELQPFPLSSRFGGDGFLMLGAVWSSDSGEGIDDRAVFMDSRGRVAIYSGSDPGSIANWRIHGVYDIGEPLARDAHLNVGGELVIATKAGLIAVSNAVRQDAGQLRLGSLSAVIDDDWREEAALAGAAPWAFAKWPRKNMVLIAPPDRGLTTPFLWAVNTHTKAFTRFTGWRVSAFGVHENLLYYGDIAGGVYQCEVGGLDDGKTFVCRACLKADAQSAPGLVKTYHYMTSRWKKRMSAQIVQSLTIAQSPHFPPIPSRPTERFFLGARWDEARWDDGVWGRIDLENYQSGDGEPLMWNAGQWDRNSWQGDEPVETDFFVKDSPGIHGDAVAIQIQLPSDKAHKADAELSSIALRYSLGGMEGGVEKT